MNKALLQKELIDLLDKHNITIKLLQFHDWEHLDQTINISIEGKVEKGDANEC